jgi:hypothetical protein
MQVARNVRTRSRLSALAQQRAIERRTASSCTVDLLCWVPVNRAAKSTCYGIVLWHAVHQLSCSSLFVPLGWRFRCDKAIPSLPGWVGSPVSHRGGLYQPLTKWVLPQTKKATNVQSGCLPIQSLHQSARHKTQPECTSALACCWWSIGCCRLAA